MAGGCSMQIRVIRLPWGALRGLLRGWCEVCAGGGAVVCGPGGLPSSDGSVEVVDAGMQWPGVRLSAVRCMTR